MPPCRTWSTISTPRVSALSMCRARSSTHCRAMALTRACARGGQFPLCRCCRYPRPRRRGPALVVVLDHVTDDGNFGAIVRSAEVVGAAGVIIANKRAAGVTVGSYKTSAGAVMHLPIAQVPNIAVRSMTSRLPAFGWAVLPSTPRAAVGMLPSRAAWHSSWAPRATASRDWCSRIATF